MLENYLISVTSAEGVTQNYAISSESKESLTIKGKAGSKYNIVNSDPSANAAHTENPGGKLKKSTLKVKKSNNDLLLTSEDDVSQIKIENFYTEPNVSISGDALDIIAQGSGLVSDASGNFVVEQLQTASLAIASAPVVASNTLMYGAAGVGALAAAAGGGGGGGSSNIDKTPPSAPALVLSTGLSNGATAAKALQSAGVVSVTAEAGSIIKVTFTDKNGHTIVKTLTGTGTPQAVTLLSADIGTSATQLGDGVVSIKAIATDAAGNTSNEGTSTFTLDTASPKLSATVQPSISKSTLTGAQAGVDETITLTLTLDSAVDGLTSGTNSGVFKVGGTAVSATWSGAAGSATRTLTYKVLTGQNGQAIIDEEALKAALVGGLKDGAGNAFDGTVAIADIDVGNNVLPIVKTQGPSVPTLTLGANVSDGATAEEAKQTTGVVLVNGEVGSTIEVTFKDKDNHSVVKRVTGTGANQAVVLEVTDLSASGGPLVDGDISVTAVATDRAGNRSVASGESVLKLDTLKPNTPTLTLGANVSDGATAEEAKQTTGVVLVNGEVGSTIEVTFKDKDNHSVVKRVTGTGANQAVVLLATDLVGGGGSLVDGDISVTAFVTDQAGNKSDTSAVSTFSLDTLKPNTPTLTLGANVSDGATAEEAKQTTGVVLVNGEVGSTIEVTFKDKNNHSVVKRVTGTGANQAVVLLATDLVGGGGSLVDGDISVTAIATDRAGNRSVVSGESVFKLDTLKPNTPTLTLGANVSDGATAEEAKQTTGVVLVNGEMGSTIEVTFKDKDNHSVVKRVTGTGANQAVVLEATDLSASGGPLVDGDISVTAVATDRAGNRGDASGISTLSLDTSKPTATFTTPADGNQGASVAGDLVMTFNETVRGKGTGNIRIYKLIDDSAPVSTIDASNATITGSGVNTKVVVAYNGLQANTRYYVVIDAGAFEDQAGNAYAGTTSVGSNGWDFTTLVASVTMDKVTGDGLVNIDEQSATITLRGNISLVDSSKLADYSAAGITVKLKPTDGGPDIIASGITYNQGSWSATIAANSLTDGKSYDATVIATPTIAGTGAGELTTTQNIYVDTLAPTAPTLTLANGVSTGATAAEATQQSGVLTVKGEAGSNIVLTFTDINGNGVSRSFRADGSLQAITLSATELVGGLTATARKLADGKVFVTATATDVAGNISDIGGTNFDLDTQAPAAPLMVLGSGSDTGTSPNDGQTKTLRPTLTGTSEAKATINIYDLANNSGAVLATVIADATTGAWSASLATDLTQGVHHLYAVATDLAGNVSSPVATNGKLFARSVGFDDTNQGGADLTDKIGVTVSGQFNRTTTGVGVTVINDKGDFVSHDVYYTSEVTTTSASKSAELATKLNTIVSSALVGYKVIITTNNDWVTSLSTDARAALKNIGGQEFILNNAAYRSSYLLITQKTSATAWKADYENYHPNAANTVLTAYGDDNIQTVNIDNATPDQPILALGSNVSDGATSTEATQDSGVVTVKAEAGSKIKVTFTNGNNSVVKEILSTGVVQGVKLLSSEVTTLLGGTTPSAATVSVSAIATDAAGNDSTAGTSSFNLDTEAPKLSSTTPTIDKSIILGTGGDSPGETIKLTLNFDSLVKGLTSGTVGNIFKVGTSLANATWGGVDSSNTRTLTYTVAAGQNGEVTIDAGTLTAALKAGLKDVSGNAFEDNRTVTFTTGALPVVDTLRPGSLSASLAEDTGRKYPPNDGVTSKPTLNVSNSEQTAKWFYKVGDAGTWTQGTGSSFNLSEGFNNYYLKQQDAAGNESIETSVRYLLDTRRPVITSEHTIISTTNDLAVSYDRPLKMTNVGGSVLRANRFDWLDLKSASENVTAYFVRTTDDSGVDDVQISTLQSDAFLANNIDTARMASIELTRGDTKQLYLGNLKSGMYSLVFVDVAGNTSHAANDYSDLPRLYIGSAKNNGNLSTAADEEKPLDRNFNDLGLGLLMSPIKYADNFYFIAQTRLDHNVLDRVFNNGLDTNISERPDGGSGSVLRNDDFAFSQVLRDGNTYTLLDKTELKNLLAQQNAKDAWQLQAKKDDSTAQFWTAESAGSEKHLFYDYANATNSSGVDTDLKWAVFKVL